MGGVIDSGGGIGVKSSPRQAAIEKAQAELRQEYDVREERRRELEFLEKGGNPLDFKFGNSTSDSVQSTSLTDKQADQLVKSEVKDSFLGSASQRGDSVESSGRPGVSIVSEPNTADNLLLFDAENKSHEGERNSKYPSKRCRTSESERSVKANNFQNAKETEDSSIFRPYARRNRSKINRDPARSSSTELVQSRGGLSTSLSIRRESVDLKGSVSCPSSATSNGNIVSNNVVPSNLLKTEDDELVVQESTATAKANPVKEKVDIACRKNSADVVSKETGLTEAKAHAVSASTIADSLSAVMTGSEETMFTQVNWLTDPRGENRSLEENEIVGGKLLNQDTYHANSGEVDVDTKIDRHRLDKSEFNRIAMQTASRIEGILSPTVGEMVNTKSEDKAGDSTFTLKEQNSEYQSQKNSLQVKNQDHRSSIELHNEKGCSETERKQQDDLDIPQNDMKGTSGFAETPESSCHRKSQESVETSTCMISKNLSSGPDVTASKIQHSLGGGPRMLDTLKEDSVLEEARIIKAKRKRIDELSSATVPVEVFPRSQWDFVLEEVAWLANDFAQERLWKMTAAMQICHRIAFTSQLKFEIQIQHSKLKCLASTLANAVLQFWSSVEVSRELEEPSLGTNTETRKELKCENGGKRSASGVIEYARRSLKFVKSSVPQFQAAALLTPENICDPGILETSWDDQLTEESLFYSIPSGAVEAYRRSIESHLVCEKSESCMQEEVETSAFDAVEDTGYNDYDDNEEETSTYYLPGALQCSKSFNLTHVKRKKSMKCRSAWSHDLGDDLPYGSSNPLMGKRPASYLNSGSVPMKRTRTASRQRVVSSFGCGTVVPPKTDASSGDTSSFQDEQSGLNGGSAAQKGIEVYSSGNYEKQLPYDMAETSGKPKKKKVHPGSAYEQAWHLDSMVHGEQDHWKKRQDNHCNTNGLYGLHSSKKQKNAKQSVENTFDRTIPVTESIPSPAASQMSNMSNPNKFIKFVRGRERHKKIKGLKISSGQQGSENPWSLFEDQALVVLVHDMGPNWELISDAMNSTLKIKCIYRKPSDCKERHKNLMDRSGGDGADSAEDSGNSQSYPSTLPGIPKGSARQLFQRLQGPVEEDTLKSHFEKICLIGKKFLCRKIQNDGRDPKQILPVHNSQIMALSHVFPNNLNGSVLTPLDLGDASASGQDLFSLEPVLNQATSGLPASQALSSITGSSDVVPSNNLLPISGPTSASPRFNLPRGSLPLDEQHRVQQLNPMSSGRNVQQPPFSTSRAVTGPDRGQRLPGGNAMSVIGNRSTTLSRPGLHGGSSLAVPNSGSMLSSSMGGIANAGNINSPGNSTLRPRGAMQHMMQAAKGNGQGIPALGSGFTSQTTTSVQAYPGHLSNKHQLSRQSHGHGNSHKTHLQSPNPVAGTQQQAYAIRQRQMHLRFLQQQKQHQQFPPSGAMTHVQSQHQVPPVSSSPQNSPQTPSLAMPLSSTSPNMTAIVQQHSQKPQLPTNGLGMNPQSAASGVNNQAGKQRQRQLQQQSGRQHPHQRQPTPGQQQNKVLKGMGRENIMHQSISVDSLHLNGSNMSQGVQGIEKIEVAVQALPGQPSKTVTAVSLYPQSKPLNSPQISSISQQQAKTFPSGPSHSSQQHQQRQLHSEISIQGEKSAEAPGNILFTSRPSVPPPVTQTNHQHLLLHQKQENQVQPTSHRTVHQYHESSKKSQAEHSPRNPQSVTNTPQMGSMGTTKDGPQASISSVSMIAADSTAINFPPKELDIPSCDSSEENGVSKVSRSITNSIGSDPLTKMAHRLGISPDGLQVHGQKGGTERQQQQPKQSPPLVQRQPHLSEQLLVQDRISILSEQQQPYLKTLELEAIHEKSSSRPPDTKVE